MQPIMLCLSAQHDCSRATAAVERRVLVSAMVISAALTHRTTLPPIVRACADLHAACSVASLRSYGCPQS